MSHNNNGVLQNAKPCHCEPVTDVTGSQSVPRAFLLNPHYAPGAYAPASPTVILSEHPDAREACDVPGFAPKGESKDPSLSSCTSVRPLRQSLSIPLSQILCKPVWLTYYSVSSVMLTYLTIINGSASWQSHWSSYSVRLIRPGRIAPGTPSAH